MRASVWLVRRPGTSCTLDVNMGVFLRATMNAYFSLLLVPPLQMISLTIFRHQHSTGIFTDTRVRTRAATARVCRWEKQLERRRGGEGRRMWRPALRWGPCWRWWRWDVDEAEEEGRWRTWKNIQLLFSRQAPPSRRRSWWRAPPPWQAWTQVSRRIMSPVWGTCSYPWSMVSCVTIVWKTRGRSRNGRAIFQLGCANLT